MPSAVYSTAEAYTWMPAARAAFSVTGPMQITFAVYAVFCTIAANAFTAEALAKVI